MIELCLVCNQVHETNGYSFGGMPVRTCPAIPYGYLFGVSASGWIVAPASEFCAVCGLHGQSHGPHSDQVQHEFISKIGLLNPHEQITTTKTEAS